MKYISWLTNNNWSISTVWLSVCALTMTWHFYLVIFIKVEAQANISYRIVEKTNIMQAWRLILLGASKYTIVERSIWAIFLWWLLNLRADVGAIINLVDFFIHFPWSDYCHSWNHKKCSNFLHSHPRSCSFSWYKAELLKQLLKKSNKQ